MHQLQTAINLSGDTYELSMHWAAYRAMQKSVGVCIHLWRQKAARWRLISPLLQQHLNEMALRMALRWYRKMLALNVSRMQMLRRAVAFWILVEVSRAMELWQIYLDWNRQQHQMNDSAILFWSRRMTAAAWLLWCDMAGLSRHAHDHLRHAAQQWLRHTTAVAYRTWKSCISHLE